MLHVTDKRLENVMGLLLRAGVLLAAAVVLAGAGLYLVGHAGELVHYSSFRPMGHGLNSIAGIFTGALHLEAAAVIQLGILLLIATPVARVALALFGFLLERDYLYTVVSAIVLGVLIYSLLQTG
jgi:uncharacterized membrane protein